MERRKKIIVAAAGAGLLSVGVAGYAIAQERHDAMRVFDADGNGQITLSEAQQASATMFARIDANGDGRATLDEARAHHRGGHRGHGPRRGPGPEGRGPAEGHGPPPFESIDLDRDGAVTLAEFQEHLRRHFVAIDADRSGSVSSEELQAAHRQRHARR